MKTFLYIFAMICWCPKIHTKNLELNIQINPGKLYDFEEYLV